MKYDHLFTIAFSVVSEDEHGEDVTQEAMAAALLKRLEDTLITNSLLEAVGGPDDTFVIDEEQEK